MNRTSLACVLALVLAGCGGKSAPTSTPAAPPSAPAATAEPSTGEQVMERAIAAQGGRDAIAKITSLRQTGTLTIAQMGAKGTMTIQAAAPRMSLTRIEIPGIGVIAQGVRDDVAWEMNPMTGSRIITGAERTMLLRESTFHADLEWKKFYAKADLGGVVDFQGAPAYKVTLTANEGDTQTRYFAKDTLLPIGLEMTVESQMGKVPVAMKLEDYRDIGGIKYAHKLVRNEGPVTLEITLDKIEQNPAIDPATFELPPEIAKLQKK